MDRDVISAIQAASAGFSKGQRKIAKYIVENYEKAAFMTASKLGDTVGVSESTVVRFAADLGYDGYPAMRKALQEMIKNCLTSVQRIEVSREMIARGDILSTVLTSDIDKIRSTLENADQGQFDAAVDTICEAKNVYILGLRSSGALATFISFYLSQLMPNVRQIHDSSGTEVFEQLLRIGENDSLIAISFPRYSRRTIRAMKYARDRGAKVIGITDTESSLVAQNADIKLYAKSDMVSFLDSLVAPLSLINALIVAVANQCEEDLAENFERLEKIWSEYDVYEKSER